MIEPYTSGKLMKPSDLTGEVFVFRSNAVREIVVGLVEILNSNDLCSKMDFKDTTLYIPTIVPAMVVSGIINLMDTFISGRENIVPLLNNYLKTEVFDGPAEHTVASTHVETIQQTLDACVILVRALINELEATNHIEEVRHGYELLKLTGTGALVVCRFRLDY